jgi:hypothetical protein
MATKLSDLSPIDQYEWNKRFGQFNGTYPEFLNSRLALQASPVPKINQLTPNEVNDEFSKLSGRRNNSLLDMFTSIPLSGETQQAAPVANRGSMPNVASLTNYIPSMNSLSGLIPTEIPNVFGQRNPLYENLLGVPQSQALSKQSNIAGLLGAAAALASGMGRQGGRRSAAQNILGALGAGYGAAGQQYQQGLQGFSTAQQLQANADKQKAFAEMAIKYPDLAPLARIDPAKFVEMVSQLEQQRPIAEVYKQAYGTPQPVQQTQPSAEQLSYQQDLTKYGQDLSGYNNQVNQMLGVGTPISGAPINVVAGATPVREPTAPLAAGNVEMNPVPEAFTGRYDASMPQAPVAPTAPVPQSAPQVTRETELRAQKDTLLRVISNLSRLGTKAANDEVKNNLEQIKVLDTQIQQYAVGGFDFGGFKKTVPTELHADIDALEKMAKSGSITGDQLRQGIQSIRTVSSQDKTADTKEYKFAQSQGFTGSFQDWLKSVKPLGATQVNVAANTFAKEFGKGVSDAIQTTYNSANAAQGTIATIQSIRPLVQAGVYAGPLSNAPRVIDQLASSLGVAGANTEEKLARTAQAMQGLASLELTAATAMKGQGQITENERALIQRAAGGNFKDFTQKEVLSLLNSLEKVSNSKIATHEKNLSALKKRKDTGDLAEFYSLGNTNAGQNQPPTQPRIRTYNPATGRIE